MVESCFSCAVSIPGIGCQSQRWQVRGRALRLPGVWDRKQERVWGREQEELHSLCE